jgi:hypothetical protein
LAPGRADRYGDLIFAPVGKLGAMRTRGDLDGCAEGSLEACNGPRLSSERGEKLRVGFALDGKSDANEPTGVPACRLTKKSVAGISAGARSVSTGSWWIDGWHRFVRRQPAPQNASTTSAFRHECCPRGDLMFPARLISNGCSWQKCHTRQLLRD